MSFSTMAAARQKEMKASMAVVATSTRGAPVILLCCAEVDKPFFIRRAGRADFYAPFKALKKMPRSSLNKTPSNQLLDVVAEQSRWTTPSTEARPTRHTYTIKKL